MKFEELTVLVDNTPGGTAAVRYGVHLTSKLTPVAPHLKLAAIVQPEPLAVEDYTTSSTLFAGFSAGNLTISGQNLASESALEEKRDELFAWSDRLSKEQVVCEIELAVDDPVPALVGLMQKCDLLIASAQSRITRVHKTPKFLASACLHSGKPLLVVQNAYDEICHIAAALSRKNLPSVVEALLALKPLARACRTPAQASFLLVEKLPAPPRELETLCDYWEELELVPSTEPRDLLNLARQAAQLEANLLIVPFEARASFFSRTLHLRRFTELLANAQVPLLLLPRV